MELDDLLINISCSTSRGTNNVIFKTGYFQHKYHVSCQSVSYEAKNTTFLHLSPPLSPQSTRSVLMNPSNRTNRSHWSIMVVLNDEYVRSLFKDNTEMKKKAHLLVSDKGINEVENLEEFRNFRIIDLRNNCILDIRNISNQLQLTHLYLQSNGIEHLHGFNVLNRLEVLFLDFNKIEVLEKLDYCPLKKISVRGQKLNEIQMFGLDPLCMKHLSDHLRELDVSSNKITTLSSLKHCKNLNILNISSNKLSNLNKLSKELSQFQGLIELDISDNPVMKNPELRVDIIFCCNNLEILNMNKISRETREFCTKVARKKNQPHYFSQPSKSSNLINALKRSSENFPYPLRPKITTGLLQEMKRKQEAMKKAF